MRILCSPRPADTDRRSPAELRAHFLVEELFAPGELNLVYTDLDRLILGGIVPHAEIPLPGFRDLGTNYFTERRELGIINIGDKGWIGVGDQVHEVDRLECLSRARRTLGKQALTRLEMRRTYPDAGSCNTFTRTESGAAS